MAADDWKQEVKTAASAAAALVAKSVIDALQCTARRIDRSYGMDARCEHQRGHASYHEATIGHGHIENWSEDVCDSTPTTWKPPQ